MKVASLADIFEHLNVLNKSLQGRDENILTAKDKINGFLKKISLWSTSLKKHVFESFPSIQRIAEENSTDPTLDVGLHIPNMVLGLQNLKEQLLSYFSEKFQAGHGQRWIPNPFLDMSVELAELNLKMKEELMELSADGMLKMGFRSERLDAFWTKRRGEYPDLAAENLKLLVSFRYIVFV